MYIGESAVYKAITMKIGTTIRGYRLSKGLSQGDIEKRTGLLRCYLSRVENGHTVPSLDTLAKIAGALELPLVPRIGAPRDIFVRRRALAIGVMIFVLLLIAWGLRAYYEAAAAG